MSTVQEISGHADDRHAPSRSAGIADAKPLEALGAPAVSPSRGDG